MTGAVFCLTGKRKLSLLFLVVNCYFGIRLLVFLRPQWNLPALPLAGSVASFNQQRSEKA